MIEMLAKDWKDPRGLIIGSGERLARAVIPLLQDGDSVSISLEGLTGVSSSYFNIFLRLIVDEVGAAAVSRISFQFPSPVLQSVYQRSSYSVLNSTPSRKS